jgi:hypothetical protein
MTAGRPHHGGDGRQSSRAQRPPVLAKHRQLTDLSSPIRPASRCPAVSVANADCDGAEAAGEASLRTAIGLALRWSSCLVSAASSRLALGVGFVRACWMFVNREVLAGGRWMPLRPKVSAVGVACG